MAVKGVWKKWGRWVQTAGIAGLLFLAWMTIHDMQTAEGTGLYLMFQAGAEKRDIFDWLVEGIGMLCLLAVAAAPCIAMKRFRPDAFLRFLAAYLAFLPTVSTAAVVHLLDGTDEILLHPAFSEGKLGSVLLDGLEGLTPVLGAGAPLLFLAAAAYAAQGETARRRGLSWKSIAVLAIWLLLVPFSLCFPKLTAHCHYLFCYGLLLYGCNLWEKLLDRFPELRGFGWILTGIFCARGIDRMMEIMSVYHI